MAAALSGTYAADPTGCSSCTGVPLRNEEFNVSAYGAKGDGVTMNTAAITNAIAAAAQAGGGRVTMSGGHFLSGQLQLASGVYLDIRPDAVLMASPNPRDYPSDPSSWVVILGVGIQNTGIIGGGTVDGQNLPLYLSYYSRADEQLHPVMWTGPTHDNCTGECRPRLVQFIECDNVLVRDVTLQNSPDWTSHYFNSTNILVTNVTVHGDERWPNNDGIDPDSSENVTISNCSVRTGDDGICLKSTCGARPLRNVLVQGVDVRSRSSGIKFGSSTCANMEDILVREVRVLAGSNRGIGIQQRDAGNLTNIEFRDVLIEGTNMHPFKWWGDGDSIWVTSLPREAGGIVGSISGLRFVRVHSRASNNGVLISSRSGMPIRGLSMSNVSFTVVPPPPPRNGVEYATVGHDYRPSAIKPDIIPAPVDGIYLEHVEDAVISGVNLSFELGYSLPGSQLPQWGSCVNGTADSMESLSLSGETCTGAPKQH